MQVKGKLQNIENFCCKNGGYICKVLVGTKCDNKNAREVSKEEVEKISSEYNIPYFETSAKNGVGVNDAFIALTDDIMVNQEEKSIFKQKEINKRKLLKLQSKNYLNKIYKDFGY